MIEFIRSIMIDIQIALGRRGIKRGMFSRLLIVFLQAWLAIILVSLFIASVQHFVSVIGG